MGMRILLLLTISWIIGLTEPLVTLAGRDFSTGATSILIGGGLFLLWKATTEIHESLEGEEAHTARAARSRASAACWCRSSCSTSCSRSTRC